MTTLIQWICCAFYAIMYDKLKLHKQIDIKNDARAIFLFTRTLTEYLDASKRIYSHLFQARP